MKDRSLQLISPILLLLIWEIAARVGVIDTRFFPAPIEIFGRLAELIEDGTLLTATVITLRRVVIGFALAMIPGVLIGVIMGISRTTRLALGPLVSALYPVPKIALVPAVLLIFGLGEESYYAVTFISVFFLVALNTLAGVLNLEQKYFDIARNNGAGRWDMLWTVAIPGALPSIFTGINLGLGFALTVVVGTELLVPMGGLGALMWQSYQIYDIATLYAGLIVVALLGWAFSVFVAEVEGQMIPWRAAEARKRRAPSTLENEPRIRRFVRMWWMATRPFSFTASVTPVTLGAVLAAYDGHWNWLLFAITLIGSVSIHAGTNLINDYYDWRKGTDTADSLGPNRALQEGMLTPQHVFWGGLIFFALGSALGLYLVETRGIFILYLGIFSVLAGWFYTAGPAAFAYVGLGEVVVFVFMGPVMVLGSYFVLTQQIAWEAVLVSLPIGFLVAAILHANNMRDLEGDLEKGKRTLANILGRRNSQREYLILVGGSYVLLAALFLIDVTLWPILLPLITLPAALKLLRTATTSNAPTVLNRVVRGTAQLHQRFGWLMILGFIVAIATQIG
ncbi:1,4-dihydroxy-2-naphthoate octaprenyltransferase [bacterium]|nr:1,4-dihydroxy-2-naphthoate octaprenyltransferase [bacterium]